MSEHLVLPGEFFADAMTAFGARVEFGAPQFIGVVPKRLSLTVN